MGKLTDRQCKTAKAGTKDEFLGDGAGLYLRVRPGESSAKVWLYRFKSLGGTGSRWFDIGTYPDVSLADARQAAATLSAKRRAGIDPIEERKEAEVRAKAEAASRAAEAAKDAARLTVGELCDRWIAVDLIRHKDKGAAVHDHMARHVIPVIGGMFVEDVRKGDITAVTDKLLADGKSRTAKAVFSLVRQMLRFAVDRDIIEFDPSSSIRKAKIGGKDIERDRILSDDEIRALAKQLPKSGLSDTAQAAVWIAIGTCCRIGELMASEWQDVDLDRKTWWIPPENSKNGKGHTIRLSEFVLARFRQMKEWAEESLANRQKDDPTAKPCPWIYPNRRKDGAVCSKTVTKQIGDRQRPGLPPMKGRAREEMADTLLLTGGKWGPHDLRRTGATMMVALGVLPEVAERCLNHTEQNRVKRTYQRHSYEKEMAEAWQLLGDRLELLVNKPDNVVVLGQVA